MRICARLGGGSTKEPGESQLTEGNEERGKTEIGVTASKTPRCAAEVAPDESRKSDFRTASNQGDALNKTQTKTEGERAAVCSCL